MSNTRPQPWPGDNALVVVVSARDAATLRVTYDVKREALRALTRKVNRAT